MSKNTPQNPIDHDDAPAESRRKLTKIEVQIPGPDIDLPSPRYTREEVSQMIESLPPDDPFDGDLRESYFYHLTASWRDVAGEHRGTGMTVGELRELLQTPEIRSVDIVPTFDSKGYGRMGNDVVSRGARLAFVAPWSDDRSEKPQFEFPSKQGTVTYVMDHDSLREAWLLVDSLGDAHADIFDYILAKMFAGMSAGTRDIYGDFTITPRELYDMRGLSRHKGGYRRELLQEIIDQVEALRHLRLEAAVREIRGGKNADHVVMIHSVNLIDIHEVMQAHIGGETTTVGWNLRPGNWARELESVSRQYAVTMQGILRLHSKRDRYAKRIGRYLLSQHRINARKRSPELVRKVRTILDQAGIEIPTRNKPEFRRKVERALSTLANADAMGGAQCIDRWRYQQETDHSASDWFVRWMDSNIVITISAELRSDRYGAIGKTTGDLPPVKVQIPPSESANTPQ